MIFDIIRENKKKIILISCISALSGCANILLLRLATSYAVKIDDVLSAIIYYWWALFLLVGLGFLSQYLLALLGAKITFEIREKLTASVANFNYEQLETIGVHRLYTTLTEDITVINNWLSIIPLLVYNGTIVFLGFVYMGIMSILLFFIVFSFLICGILVSRLFIIKRGTYHFKSRRTIQDKLFDCYRSVVEGFKELNFNKKRRDQFHNEELLNSSNHYRYATGKASFYFTLANSWNSGMLFLAVGSVVFMTRSVFSEMGMELLPFIVVVFYVMGPIVFLMNSWQNYSQASVVINRLRKLNFNHTPKVSIMADGSEFQHLSLKKVSYIYANDDISESFEFGPFDLEIEKGDIVFFVGGNGSGKTTAAKLLTGLYEPVSGSITLNSIQLERDKIDWYNKYFSTIFADYHLFKKVINKHGNDVEDHAIAEFIKKMNLEEKVSIKDGVFSTLDLSEGQKKRLALLISYFEDADIYVFDEWAAEQDPHFRGYFYEQFLPELSGQGKTVIVITHDDRYFHIADKIVKFERGKVVASESDYNHV